MATLGHLPTPLHELAACAPDSPTRQVRITHRGEMWLKPGGRAMAFTAVQDIAVVRADLVGRARERVRKYGVPLSVTLGRHMNARWSRST